MHEIARNQRVKWDSNPPPPLPPTTVDNKFTAIRLVKKTAIFS